MNPSSREQLDSIGASTTSTDVKIAVMIEKINQIQEDMAAIRNEIVTQAEFRPVKNIVYGMVGTALLAVLTGLLTMVIKQ